VHTFALSNGEDWPASTKCLSVILSHDKNAATYYVLTSKALLTQTGTHNSGASSYASDAYTSSITSSIDLIRTAFG